MVNQRAGRQGPKIAITPSHATVARLAWVFGDRDVAMYLRLDILREAVRHRHRVLALAPNLTTADQITLSASGIESVALRPVAARYNPLGTLSARRRLAHSLHDWRATAVIIEDGDGLDLATRAARQAGIGAIYPVLPALEVGTAPHSAATRSKTSWRPALQRASSVFVPTPNDARLVMQALALTNVSHHLLPSVCLHLGTVGAEPLPAIDGGFIFLGLETAFHGDPASPFALAVGAFDVRGTKARFRTIEIDLRAATHQDGAAARPRPELLPVHPEVGAMMTCLRTHVRSAHVVVIDGVGPLSTLLLALALALGRPVLAIDHPAYRDFVDVGVNGWLVPPDDQAALAQAMTAILKRPDLLPGMARAARQKAERRLDQHAVIASLFEVLKLSDLRADAA